MRAIGFDIGGTKLLCAIAQAGQVEEIRQYPTPQDRQSLLSLICTITADYGRERAVEGVGIGLAGAKRQDGTVWCPNLPALTGIFLETVLQERLSLPVAVENDAHAALYGELWQGALRGQENAVMVSIGTGVGAAAVVDGRVLRGSHGVAGAAGWLCIPGPSTQRAHLEEWASGTGLNALAREAGFQDAKALIRACRAESASARSILHQWTEYLGLGIASLVSVYDVETVVLSGGLAREYDLYAQKLLQVVRAWASPLNGAVQIHPSALAEKACLYGAIRLGQEAGRK